MSVDLEACVFALSLGDFSGFKGKSSAVVLAVDVISCVSSALSKVKLRFAGVLDEGDAHHIKDLILDTEKGIKHMMHVKPTNYVRLHKVETMIEIAPHFF